MIWQIVKIIYCIWCATSWHLNSVEERNCLAAIPQTTQSTVYECSPITIGLHNIAKKGRCIRTAALLVGNVIRNLRRRCPDIWVNIIVQHHWKVVLCDNAKQTTSEFCTCNDNTSCHQVLHLIYPYFNSISFLPCRLCPPSLSHFGVVCKLETKPEQNW